MSEETSNTENTEQPQENSSAEEHGVLSAEKISEITQRMSAAIRAGKEAWEQLAQEIHKDLIINGKHIDTWKKEFHVDIPPDLNPTLLKELNVKMIEKFQEASFYLAMARQKATMSNQGTKISYEAAYLATVAEYKSKNKRMPAASTLENIAKIQSTTHDSISRYAEAEMKFWRDILDGLDNTRRMIEDATRNVTQELKADFNVKNIDALNAYNNNTRRQA